VLLYRIFGHDPDAATGEPGHPDFLYPGQGSGRWDNPDHYLGWYMASSPAAAVGEVFGDLASWDDAMFDFPFLEGARRVLGTYSVPDSIALLDLDDAAALADRTLRPTQVVSPNRVATQRVALDIFNEQDRSGARLWAGVTWWSSRRAYWPVHFIWGQTPACESIDSLHVAHPAVRDAATALSKPLG
jgi:hypothetical protein